MYVVTCPLCEAILSIEAEGWSWAFIYSTILMHLDREHPTEDVAEHTVLAETLTDDVIAQDLMWRLLSSSGVS